MLRAPIRQQPGHQLAFASGPPQERFRGFLCCHLQGVAASFVVNLSSRQVLRIRLPNRELAIDRTRQCGANSTRGGRTVGSDAVCIFQLTLKRERAAKELSLTRLAENAVLSRQMVSYVERGLRVPGLDTLIRICRVLGLNAADVIRRAQR